MKPKLARMIRPLVAILCGTSLIAASPFVFAQTTNSDDDQAKISRLLKEIDLRKSSPPERDANGNIVTLLVSQNVDDQRIEAASKIHSLRELQIWYPQDITKAGVSHLIGMTNLISIKLGCCPELNPGVFEEICKIHGLRRFSLIAARPPAKEYTAITNLQLLTELHLGVGTNFGDHELSILTNLHNLKSLEIRSTRITPDGLKVLWHMNGLTNVIVAPPE